MAAGDHAEGIVGDINGQADIRIGEGGVDEMVVMAGDEQAAGYALRHPFLMEH